MQKGIRAYKSIVIKSILDERLRQKKKKELFYNFACRNLHI